MYEGHGRVETRRSGAIDIRGRGLRSGALVETEHFVAEPQEEPGPVQGETETERLSLISSLEADVEKIPRAAHRKWQIGSGLHEVLDMDLREDHSYVRTDKAAENIVPSRRLVASVVKQNEKIDAATQNKRMRTVRDDEYREHHLEKRNDTIAL